MPLHFNALELVIVLVIVLVLFGAGRVTRLGGELGSGIREFRKGLNGGDVPSNPVVPVDPTVIPPTPINDVTNKPL